MDGPRDRYSVTSVRKANIVYYRRYVESRKMVQVILLTKRKKLQM